MSKVCKQCRKEYTVGNSFHKLCSRCNEVRLGGNKKQNKDVDVKVSERKVLYSMKVKTQVISKPTPKGVKHEVINPYMVDTLKEFFAIIWEIRPHICCHCGCKLGDEPIAHFFSHIYPKSIRPWLKLDPNNIELLCVECHTAHDFGKRITKL